MSKTADRVTQFTAEQIKTLSLRLKQRKADRGATPPAIVRVGRTETLPLSFAQQRLWFIDRLSGGGDAAYNVPVAVRLRGALDIPALSASLSEIVRRHEVLRTTFPTVASAPVQRIHDPQPVPLPVTDLSHLSLSEREQAARELTAAEVTRPFDLVSDSLLLRASLIRLDEQEHVLIVVLHHIVSDGWSTGVLVEEFGQLYAAYTEGRPSPLPDLPIQYADYAVWQREWLTGEVLESQLSYWRTQLAGMERLELTPDVVTHGASTAATSTATTSLSTSASAASTASSSTATPTPPPAAGATVRFTASGELTAALHEAARREGVTLFMLLTAAFQLLLSRHSGQADIAIGTDIANRNRLETEPLVGFFINQLVLRARLDECAGVRDLLAQVRETVLGAYAHQELPFERLVEDV
ncbi:MAG: hypothetical protein QOG00_2650, partial [Pyrinomonadaceae bacterium]|nr:hypothetical protein [Pyrinomonadaceae bacterium]